MSKLIVEVCVVEEVNHHPNADRLDICRIKGWNVITRRGEFAVGEKCIYFPPDAVLPAKIYQDRLDVSKYLHDLPKNPDGSRPVEKRVVASRLRGLPSFGLITKIDPKWGDDPEWMAGTDLVERLGVTKYEPPMESAEGDVDRPNNRFFGYTSIENFGNYPTVISDGEEVVITEKIHGKNSRLGLVLEENEVGESEWTWMAGSHGLRRKEFVSITHRFKLDDLQKWGLFVDEDPKIGDVFEFSGKRWQIDCLVEPTEKSTEQILKIQVTQVNPNGDQVLVRSEYWEPLTENLKSLLLDVRDNLDVGEVNFSVIVYGEIYGNVQDMKYGLPNGKSFRAFDIAVNNMYLDYDLQMQLFTKHNISVVPVLYRGPFSVEVLKEHTSGATTLCTPEVAGKFAGREGVVVKPTREVYCPIMNGRKILKSISADYLARKNGTEFH